MRLRFDEEVLLRAFEGKKEQRRNDKGIPRTNQKVNGGCTVAKKDMRETRRDRESSDRKENHYFSNHHLRDNKTHG